MYIDNLIVGCGISGIVIAEQLASRLGEDVLIVDKRDHIGGNCFDYSDVGGITVHKYGPHIFHTNEKIVWDYLSRFTQWHFFILKPLALIDNNYVNLPFNLDTLHTLFPESLAKQIETKLLDIYGFGGKISIMDLAQCNEPCIDILYKYIYDKIFNTYTQKQWGVSPYEIDKSVTARVPILISRDRGYFQDVYQGIPLKGYTEMFNNMLINSKIKVDLNCSYSKIKDIIQYKRIFFSGSIDEFFDYQFGVLPYRSLRFDIRLCKVDYFQNSAVVNYPCNYDFTRICEHKHFLNEKSPDTVISIEYPEAFTVGVNERYYPISMPEYEKQYEQYRVLAKKMHNTFFIGRLGEYRYYNMDKAVAQSLSIASKLIDR